MQEDRRPSSPNPVYVTERPRRSSPDVDGNVRRWQLSGHSPHLECRACGMPIILQNVERDGRRRALTCPYCAKRDEWEIVDR